MLSKKKKKKCEATSRFSYLGTINIGVTKMWWESIHFFVQSDRLSFFFLFIFKSVLSTVEFHGEVLVFFLNRKQKKIIYCGLILSFFLGGDCIILLSIKIMIWYSNLSINIYLICFLESFKIQVASCEFIHPYKETIWSRT